MRDRKVTGTLLWTFQMLFALSFIAIGIGKFRNAFWIEAFPRWGLSDRFRMLVGVLEIAGGGLLALPKTASYAAALICAIMVGAAATVWLHHDPIFAPVFWFGAVGAVGLARWSHAWRPARRTHPAPADRL